MTAIESLKADLAKVYARPCRCVSCAECRGTGNIRVDMFTGFPQEFWDDLCDLESCDQCQGGIVEVCDRCREAEELDQLIEEEDRRERRIAI